MKAALLPDRGVVKVAGDEARKFLNGLLTTEMAQVTPAAARFAALLTPQGKIIVDFIIAENRVEDGGGFFLDCPRALSTALADRLNFYKLRAKVVIEDVSQALAVLAVWDGSAETEFGLTYRDPRHPGLGTRVILPPHVAAAAAADLGAELVDAAAYEIYRVTLGIPRGGLDFIYGDAFPHEADMDQLNGVDFDKGCFVGQEVVSRMQHRRSARKRVVPVAFDGFGPEAGIPILAGERPIGVMGSSTQGRGLAMLRLDRLADAYSAGDSLVAGGVPIQALKPDWARFPWPGEEKGSG
jgi:folate-binding protein YgfZ